MELRFGAKREQLEPVQGGVKEPGARCPWFRPSWHRGPKGKGKERQNVSCEGEFVLFFVPRPPAVPNTVGA